MMSAASKTAPAELETPRLHLRAWTDDDLPAFAAMNADPEVMRHFPEALTCGQERPAGETHPRQHDETWLGPVGGRSEDRTALRRLCRPRDSHHSRRQFMPAVEIGWRLSRDCWGRGFATEGAQAA